MSESAAQPERSEFSPLEGMRVLDFSKILAGPLCTQYLGDMGADVVKIETRTGDDTRHWPPFEDGDGTIFLAVNRNKRSLALDLKAPQGLAICERLAKEADVVVESFSPGVADRLGIGYERLRALNPRLVYCSLSGYGTRGSMRREKGYDLVLQAFCGMLSITGEPDGPPVRSPFSPVDQGTGLHAVIGILGGLLQRARTGVGIKIESSLFDSAVGFLGYYLQSFWQRGTEPKRVGAGHESLCPYQVFETADRPLILGVANDTLWRAFCDVVDEPALADDPRYATGAVRVANRAETVAEVSRIMLRRTRAEWMALLEGPGIPCSPVHNLGELVAHPHTRASDMILSYENERGRSISAVAAPLRADGERPRIRRIPPRLGEHSREVLSECGYGREEIDGLLERSIVRAGG